MTNKIELRSTEQFLADFQPTYKPVMPLFLAKKSVQYAVEVGKVDFKRATAIGDLRARLYGPKDTEMHQLFTGRSSKSFNKYVLGAQYRQSELQDRQGIEDVNAQVLDEHNKQNDELFVTGGGTANNNVQNNGLFYSGDANHVTKSSAEVDKASDGTHSADFYQRIVNLVEEADSIDGEKLVLTYGANAISKYNALFANNSKSLAAALGETLPEVSFAKLPTTITPAGDGVIIVNLDQVKTHYMLLPTIFAQGINQENMYSWANFLMGSSMLEVLVPGAVTRQPLTFEA